MNVTNRPLNWFCRIALWTLVYFPLGMRAQTTPEIIRAQLEKTNILVTVRVPFGLRKITLESRTRFSTGTWAPQSVARLDGSGGEWTFVLPRTVDLELLRVRGDAAEPFPVSFYQGTNEFIGPPTSGGGRGEFLGTIDAVPEDASGKGGDRAVVESDIWKLRGDNLYFFNQYRGLQVIDISRLDAPKLRGALSLPATGEQLYLMNDLAILLTRDCNVSPGKSTVLIVDTTSQPIQIVGRVEVEGTIQESRMVGSALYVASETYRPVTVVDPKLGTTWEWGTIVTSMDLSTPTSPKLQGSLWYPGSGNVLTATDRYLFVSVRDPSNWWHSQIHLIDISDATGVMVRRGVVRPQGQVPDKFKMHLSGDIFAVVSETWSDRAQWTSVLETFDVVNPQTPVRLGGVVIKAGERLFATRFDGARAYVVTFRQIDPLFVVDLSDPRNPNVAGELEVPGWSTYIHPLGDRLVSIGIDNVNGWRVAVSLFDVKNPAAPALLSRVPVGENHSWSEANTDEKAFGIFPDLGLLLVPFQGASTNGSVSRVQLIDLEENRLVARGSVEHTLVPRRATVHRDRIVSISGRELLSLNAVNRDRPIIEGSLELSWRVDRVVATANHLLEFSSANSWDTPKSLLRVASSLDPDVVLRTTSLGSLPVLGSSTRDNTLYVLQGKSEWWWPTDALTEPKPPVETNMVLTTLDLTALPEIRVLGRTEIAAPPLGWSTDWRALWVKEGVIVWSGGGGYWNWWGRGGPVAIDALPTSRLWAPWFGGQGGRLMAFDVTDREKPRLASDLNLMNNQRWNFSQAFHADGRVFFSHDSSEFLDGVVPPGFVPAPPVVTKDPVTGQLTTNTTPAGTWVQTYSLNVVDYADPFSPTVRKPASLPGRLVGLSHGGNMLYSVGPLFDAAKWTTDWNEWLTACSYDGVSSHQVDTLPLPLSWPHPLVVHGTHAFIGRPAEGTDGKPLLESWTVSGAGKWIRVGATQLEDTAINLAVLGDMMVVQESQSVVLYNATQPTGLSRLGAAPISGCLGFDLSRADGNLSQGIWIPLLDYGVMQLRIP